MTTLLIESGIDLDTPNKQGLTALHVAARYGHINLVRHLCLAGCDVDKTNRGIRADVTAIKYGYPDIANLLDKLRNVSFPTIYMMTFHILKTGVRSRFNPLSAESARKLHTSAATDTQTNRQAAHKTARTLRFRKIIIN